ncbi:hypothetical protein ACH4UM_37925 [Streptomyces sp. NPDC020801]|uniref:hypothetical protein n=1 Tax=Streptomyces sp. NPDC020801 TaxID=3365093 RepID=UPI0037A7DAF1
MTNEVSYSTTGYYVYFHDKKSSRPVEGWSPDGFPLIPSYGDGRLKKAQEFGSVLGIGTCGRVLGVLPADGWTARYSITGNADDPEGVIVLPVLSWIITSERNAHPVTVDWPDDLSDEYADYKLIDLVPPAGIQAPHLVKPSDDEQQDQVDEEKDR